jgi:hypothetical protein
LNFPYEVYRIRGTEALARFRELRAAAQGVPVILGSQEKFDRLVACMTRNSDKTTDELIAAAVAIDPVQWLRTRASEDSEYYEVAAGPWPDGEDSPNRALWAHRDSRTQEPYSEVLISVIPAPEPWMVPCFLRIGNWNSVPKAEEHASLFKYWLEQYGAVVASVADDVIEMTVDRPPTSRADALFLARQHHVYCPDIVHQNLGSIEALAAGLLNGKTWFFWWD